MDHPTAFGPCVKHFFVLSSRMFDALLTAYIVAGVGMVMSTGMPVGRWRYLIAAAGVVAWPLFLGWGLYLTRR